MAQQDRDLDSPSAADRDKAAVLALAERFDRREGGNGLIGIDATGPVAAVVNELTLSTDDGPPVGKEALASDRAAPVP